MVYFRFEDDRNDVIQDDASNHNDGKIIAPASAQSFSETCGKGLALNGGAMLLSGDTFKNKPKIGLTFSTWINLEKSTRDGTLFSTLGGPSSSYKAEQFMIEITNGKLRCSHWNEVGKLVFQITSNQTLKQRVWNHVACTYDSQLHQTAVFVNGKRDATGGGRGFLSQDWEGKASIGSSESSHSLYGKLDEFYMADTALNEKEVSRLMDQCLFQKGGSETLSSIYLYTSLHTFLITTL